MSAIYGMYHWGGKEYEPVVKQMEATYAMYCIDCFDNGKMERAEFGCGIQYFTQEAEREVLPIVDEKNKILLTADVVLDNRAELMKQLEIEKPNLPDGKLVHAAYIKWGEEFVKLLRGVFAIAIYDAKKKSLYLYTDHMGSRAINYYVGKDGFIFSTTYAGILSQLTDEKYSEKWITACEAVCSPDMELYPEYTPYEKIMQLSPGTYLEVSEHSFEKKVYWDPRKKRAKMQFDDKLCRDIFLDTFKQCVKDVLRSKKNTAIMVSSGLDSTSVACVAAEYLEKEGKKLYSYTSIPEGEFEYYDNYAIANEAWGPQEIKKKYPNVEVNLVDCPGMDGFTKLERLVKQLEVPTKSAPNMMWIDEVYHMAKDKDCYILLKGQYGNATISYGKILGNIYYQIKHGHFLRAYNEMNAFGRKNRIPRKQIVKNFFKELQGRREKIDFLTDTLLMDDLLKKYDFNQCVYKKMQETGGGYMDTEEQERNFRFDEVNLAQLGIYDTHYSLIHGVLVRDPTKDKRLVELCMNLPIECLVHDGVERRLAREYMSGIVPDAILSQVSRRGLQSADYVERVKKNWKEKQKLVTEKISKLKNSPYFDEQKLDVYLHKLEKLEELQEEEAELICFNAFNLFAFSTFLEQNKEKEKE